MPKGSRHASRLAAAVCAVLAVLAARCGGPGPAAGAMRAWRVPVLMYHKVDTTAPAHDLIELHLTVMAQAFDAQIRLLRRDGYRPLTLDDVWAAMRGRAYPDRGVVLTFDDGYEDNYAVAYPILKKYRWKGTFFIVTSTIGTPGHMTRAQVAEMAKAGMSFESHGVHHIDFSRLSLGAAGAELSTSKRLIAVWSGHPVDFFAYPAGRYTAALGRVLHDLGYHGALTEVPGFVTPASNPYAMDRVRVDHFDSLAVFAAKLGLPRPGTP